MKRFLLSTFLMALPAIAVAQSDDCLNVNPNKKPQRSVEACSRFIKSHDLPANIAAAAYNNRGIAYRELGHFSESLSDLEQATALAPEDMSIKRMLAWTYREMGRPTDAEHMYTEILKLDQHWQGWLSRCAVRFDLGKYKDAIADCAKAGDQNYNVDVMYFKGASEVNIDQPAEALKTVAPGLDQPDFNGRLYHIAAVALWNIGLHDDAIDKAKDGLAKYPDDPDLLRFISQ